jgi:V8-like Glu-specific endopeptidase
MKKTIFTMLFTVLLSTSYADDVIYGEDNRQEAAKADKSLQPIISATAAKIDLNYLRFSPADADKKMPAYFYSAYLSHETKLLARQKASTVCEGTAFITQNAISHCSGTLIGSKYILTARHCILNQSYWIFDYLQNEDFKFYIGGVSKVYASVKTYLPSKASLEPSVENPAAFVLSYPDAIRAEDFAIVELHADVVGRTPVKLSSTALKTSDEIYMFGFPAGLPMKYTDQGKILLTNSTHYYADSDSVSGNSGSAVYKKDTQEIAGILVAGSQDYKVDTKRDCITDQVCKSTAMETDPLKTCSSEEIVRADKIIEFYKLVIEGKVPAENTLPF